MDQDVRSGHRDPGNAARVRVRDGDCRRAGVRRSRCRRGQGRTAAVRTGSFAQRWRPGNVHVRRWSCRPGRSEPAAPWSAPDRSVGGAVCLRHRNRRHFHQRRIAHRNPLRSGEGHQRDQPLQGRHGNIHRCQCRFRTVLGRGVFLIPAGPGALNRLASVLEYGFALFDEGREPLGVVPGSAEDALGFVLFLHGRPQSNP